MFYSEGARCCCKHGIAWIWIDVVVVTTALIVEGFYLAQSDDAVLFVIVLRLVRICNGLFQQVRWRQLARKVLGWPKRYKLAHTFGWECSCRRLKLAQFLGQLGVFPTCSQKHLDVLM